MPSSVFPRRPLIALVTALSVAGCAYVGGTSAPANGGEGPAAMALESGGASRADERRAVALLQDAREALTAGRPADARATARRVVDEYARTGAAGAALAVVAEAALELGDGDEAAASADRLVGLLPVDHPLLPDMLVVRAEARLATARPGQAVSELLAAPPGALASRGEAPVRLAREALERLEPDEIVARTADVGADHPLAPMALAARAAALLRSGGQGAPDAARRALEAGATGADAELARAVLEGRAPGGGRAPARVATLLPLSGSPALERFSADVRRGIEAAVAASDFGDALTLDVLDSGADGSASRGLIATAEGEGAVAVIGPLQSDATRDVADARARGIPVVSPTALELPPGREGVYSLSGPDPGAALALASWAADAGIRGVVVIGPVGGPSADEARAFEEAFRSRGGSVSRTLAYAAGATNFQEQLRTVRSLRPEALVLTIPPEDVQGLAAQMTFFGLDTLGIQVLGTAGWTDPAVLERVSPRHTDGVVVATPDRPGAATAGFRRFEEAYERTFRRSLVDPTAAALGWDAASLVLRALESGARTPEAVRRALESIEGFEGATGVLSVRNGRVEREHRIACLFQGEVLPVPAGARPEAVYRTVVAEPGAEPPVRRQPRPAGFRCPGVPADAGSGR